VSRDWLPPPPPRSHPGWVIASVLVHVALVAVLVVSGRVSRQPTITYIVLDEAAPGPTVPYDIPYFPSGGGGTSQEVGTGGQRPRPAAPGAPRSGDGIVAPFRPDTTIAAVGPADTGLGLIPGRRILGAEFGDGRVWVRPWDAIAAAIAGAGDETADTSTHIARIDSAINARITAFLDTLSPDSMAIAMPPSWVADIGGQKWGIDQGWIYLGNLKLPTALLALLPLPQGNYEEAQHAAELQRIRADIIQAARRAESAAEFRKYVEETRKRRDAEREERRRQQQAKPDSISG